MAYSTPLCTPDGTPLRIHVVESSTPWSEILLEELRTSIRFHNSPRRTGRFGYRTRLRSFSRILWLTILMIVLLWWWLERGKQSMQMKYKISQTSTVPNLDGLQFIDASHPYIRFVGRWTSSPDNIRKDASFPGIYFDFALNGSSTVLLSLNNADQSRVAATISDPPPNLKFLASTNTPSAEPISLLARVDDEEYLVLPNATSIVSVRRGSLAVRYKHEIRIIAPMLGGNTIETLQFEGLWIDEAGQLLPLENARSENINDDGKESPPDSPVRPIRKVLEIVTDLPGSMAGRNVAKDLAITRGILGGVMGWDYLLGEMFGSDHVTVGMNGMCLIQDCIGGTGRPAGLADVFFQSGTLGSDQYVQPWLFQSYVPDVMIMNIGNSDWDSFQMHNEEYNKTNWELSVIFEDTYISLVKAIRELAYPKYTTGPRDFSRHRDSPQSAAAELPIFIMRPLRGQLEQATHSVVDRLREDGDSTVFWLDTSGWLNTDVDFDGRPEDQDFFLDDESPSKQWRLTERGNQRVAILLHMHVCRFLARDAEKCAFLPPEIYQGKSFDAEGRRLDALLSNESERKSKKLFWD